MSEKEIRDQITYFEGVVQKLSLEIGKASSLWQDNKYSELYSSVAQVATLSRDFMATGDKCINSLSQFNKISEEKY